MTRVRQPASGSGAGPAEGVPDGDFGTRPCTALCLTGVESTANNVPLPERTARRRDEATRWALE
jgi:hypothetical protein